MALKCNCVTVRRDFDNESAGRQSICQRGRLPVILKTGDVSAHAIRDATIPFNPLQQNEVKPKYPIAIEMEYQLLMCAE